MIPVFIWSTYPLRLTVYEQFHLISIIIVSPEVDLVTLFPVPVRIQMQNIFIRTPTALIHIVDILRETRQIDNAKIRTAGRPTERCRLSDIIKSGPYELPHNKFIVLHIAHCTLMGSAPRHMAIIVGRA